MTLFYYFFIFALGICFGSFLNVLVDRGQKGRRLSGFSQCDFCGYQLKWFDNLPIVSFFILKGKCRKCRKKLSWQYPAIEAALGFLFLLAAFQAGMPDFLSGLSQGFFDYRFLVDIIFYFFIVFIFLAIFLWDLKYMIIPNNLVVLAAVAAVLYAICQFFISDCSILNIRCAIISNLIGGVITFLFFYLMFYFSKGKWIGGGDVKLGFLIGFLVGWEKVYLMLMVSYLLGGAVAVFLLLRGKKKMKSQIPFGPFLLIGCLITFFWGQEILNWYYGLVL